MVLEAESQSHLHDSSFTPRIGLPEVLIAAGDRAARIVRGESGVDAPDLRMVEQVENLTAESYLRAFRNCEVLNQACVHIPYTRHAERIPLQVAVLAFRRSLECRRIEPLILVLSRIGVTYEIGVLLPESTPIVDPLAPIETGIPDWDRKIPVTSQPLTTALATGIVLFTFGRS